MSDKDETVEEPRMDKTVFQVFDSFEAAERAEREYEHGLTPQERMEILEVLRQRAYGYGPTHAGLQRLLEAAQRGGD